MRADCAVEYTDGIDVDRLLEQELRAWYVNLLDTAPPEMLAPENIAGSTSAQAHIVPGAARISLPENCRRVLDIKLKGWSMAVKVLPSEHYQEMVRHQTNPFTASTIASPVAVMAPWSPDGVSAAVVAWPPGSIQPQVETLTAICDPGPDKYILDETALATLPANGSII